MLYFEDFDDQPEKMKETDDFQFIARFQSSGQHHHLHQEACEEEKIVSRKKIGVVSLREKQHAKNKHGKETGERILHRKNSKFMEVVLCRSVGFFGRKRAFQPQGNCNLHERG